MNRFVHDSTSSCCFQNVSFLHCGFAFLWHRVAQNEFQWVEVIIVGYFLHYAWDHLEQGAPRLEIRKLFQSLSSLLIFQVEWFLGFTSRQFILQGLIHLEKPILPYSSLLPPNSAKLWCTPFFTHFHKYPLHAASLAVVKSDPAPASVFLPLAGTSPFLYSCQLQLSNFSVLNPYQYYWQSHLCIGIQHGCR